MLGAIRRCPPPTRLRLLSSTCSSTPSLQAIASIAATRPSTRLIALSSQIPSFRSLHVSPLRWNSSHEAAVEAQIEQDAAGAQPPEGADVDKATQLGNIDRFSDLEREGLVHHKIIKNIAAMKIETMTQVQSLTINEALTGKDIVAQAKTGTGKTLAFLLPIIQRIISQDPQLAESRLGRTNGADIRGIIISPTRELAEQIAVEAEKLVRGTSVKVQRAVGGTQRSDHLRRIRYEGCHLLVGTPGRLKDLLSDDRSGVRAPMLDAFVLDEADRLMDQGFWPDIQEIQELLPPTREHDRQSLLFSATMPKDVVRLARTVMKRDLHFVQTVQEDEVPTHERVPQKLVAVPGFENQLPALLELIQREIDARSDSDKKPFKAIVYFAATAEVIYADKVIFSALKRGLANSLRCDVFSIHGQLSQGRRTSSAENFRRARSAILMSTDVTARGLDFPGVTHVIQIGLPRDRESYVHRIGRTARAGAEGEGWLILPSQSLSQGRRLLHSMPLTRDNTLETAKVSFKVSREGEVEEPAMPDEAKQIFDSVREAASSRGLEMEQDTVYNAAFGFCSTWDKYELVDSVNRWSAVEWSRASPPTISRKLASTLGIARHPGVNIRDGSYDRGGFGARDGGRSGRSGSSYNSRGDDAFSNGDDAFGSPDAGRRGDRRDSGGRNFGGRGSSRRSSGGFDRQRY